MNDYQNKCGACMNYQYLVTKGKITKRGRCILKDRVDYHQASQKACKQYIKGQEDGKHI